MDGEAGAAQFNKKQGKAGVKGSITDKEFYKAMQKLKDRGTNAVPPKKSASAYIIFGKEVHFPISSNKYHLFFSQYS